MWACYRFTVKLRQHASALADCLDRVSVSLQAAIPGLGGDVATDASDMPAFANGQRFVLQHGLERERYSDADASSALNDRHNDLLPALTLDRDTGWTPRVSHSAWTRFES